MKRLGALLAAVAMPLVIVGGCGEQESKADRAATASPATTPTAVTTVLDNTVTRAAAQQAVSKPPIASWFIPFPDKRKREMAAYSRRHYGIDSYRLTGPKVIVEHVSITTTARAVYNTFAPDRRDPELNELPGTCAHYVVDRNGKIYQLVSLKVMCRHAIGMNYTSIGIEHVGLSDSDVTGRKREMEASLALTAWLRCRYGIADRNVVGHAETLSSPYFRERVKKLADSTHSDMKRSTMQRYRARLGRRPCPA